MARTHGSNARLYINEFNLSGRSNTLELNIILPPAEVTAFEDDAKAFVAGKSQRGWDSRVAAWWDGVPADLNIDEIVYDLLSAGLGNHIGMYFDGPAAGQIGYEGVGGVERDSIKFPINNAGQLEFNMRGNTGLMIGRSMKLREQTVVTAIENGTGQQHDAAATGDTIISVVRVTGVTGAGSITVELEEDATDATYNQIGAGELSHTFTAVGSDSKRLNSAAGAEGPWYRHRVTAYSGFTDVTLRSAVAIVPGG